jgi:hypothetical protein
LSWKRTLNEAAAVNEKKVMSIVEELAWMYKKNPDGFGTMLQKWWKYPDGTEVKIENGVLTITVKKPESFWLKQSDIGNAWLDMPLEQKAIIEQAVKANLIKNNRVLATLWILWIAIVVWWCTVLVKKNQDEGRDQDE